MTWMAFWHESKPMQAFQNLREEVSNHVALKQKKRTSIYCVIYLSVAGFTINIFLLPFYKKMCV